MEVDERNGKYKGQTGSVIKVDDNTYEGEKRFITGNVLTGERINADGYLGFYDFQISVITEGNYSEFFGWLLPGFHKYSLSRTFFSLASWIKCKF